MQQFIVYNKEHSEVASFRTLIDATQKLLTMEAGYIDRVFTQPRVLEKGLGNDGN